MKLGAPKLLPSTTSKPKEDTDDSDEEKLKNKSPPTKKSVLFDSSDSEDDLFSEKTSLPKKAVVAKKVPKTEDYQSISVQNEKLSEKNKENKQENEILSKMANISENVASIPHPPRKNVFGDSSEDDDDISLI